MLGIKENKILEEKVSSLKTLKFVTVNYIPTYLSLNNLLQLPSTRFTANLYTNRKVSINSLILATSETKFLNLINRHHS